MVNGWVQSGAITFPLGTLVVNFCGSLSLIIYISEYAGLFSEEELVFWATGLLGSFTTMSTFSYESFRLLAQNEYMLFVLNIVGALILIMVAIYVGKRVVASFMVGTK